MFMDCAKTFEFELRAELALTQNELNIEDMRYAPSFYFFRTSFSGDSFLTDEGWL